MISLVKKILFQNQLTSLVKITINQTRRMAATEHNIDFFFNQIGSSDSKQLKASEFCKQYVLLSRRERAEFLKRLAFKYGFDERVALSSAENFLSQQDRSTAIMLNAAEKLRSALNPIYANAFTHIRKLDGGVKFLVDLRADLLSVLPMLSYDDDTKPYLKALNTYLRDTLAFAFNIGFLNLERVTWASPCEMLEKISRYEAVHPIRDWIDLKRRVGPYRRCYIFTHNCMPKEPIVVLHTALTSDISSNISSIVRHHPILSTNDAKMSVSNQVEEDPTKIKAAIFYSVSSTQKGLHGIELGNQLIKKVVYTILDEFPQIDKLSSLSPVPGFREWLLIEIKKQRSSSSVISKYFGEQHISFLREMFPSDPSDMWSLLGRLIATNRWINDSNLKEFFKIPLMRSCAHYLHNEKRRSYSLNSVAHFHLRNGAVLWRLNWLADISPRGLDNSCGIMVNYRYFIERGEINSIRYINNYHIAISDDVQHLLNWIPNSSL